MIPRYSRDEMSSLWSDEARFQLWLEVETAAMEQMVIDGDVPKQALDDVKNKGAFDVNRVLELEKTVKHDVIAFLTNVAEHVGESARFLHLGMTSSDLLDTTFAIQLTRATDLILSDLGELTEAVGKRAQEHKYTVCIGRSHGIHAEPMTFGLKLASWFAELERQRVRIEQAREDIAAGAISGPVGTFAHLNPAVESFVCKKFGLRPDPCSTQIISRDRHAALFMAFAGLASSLERIAVEVRHLQRTEVREAEENFTKGQKGSSAMPHKRNPVLSENITGLARLVRGMGSSALENVALWHERDISHSAVERVIAPDITVILDFMLHRTKSIVSNLQVYPEVMQKNLELTGGLQFSGTLLVLLAAKGLSRENAYALVQGHALDTWEEISQGELKVPFAERIKNDSKIKNILSEAEIEEAFAIDRHLAHVDFIFDRVFGGKDK